MNYIFFSSDFLFCVMRLFCFISSAAWFCNVSPPHRDLSNLPEFNFSELFRSKILANVAMSIWNSCVSLVTDAWILLKAQIASEDDEPHCPVTPAAPRAWRLCLFRPCFQTRVEDQELRFGGRRVIPRGYFMCSAMLALGVTPGIVFDLCLDRSCSKCQESKRQEASCRTLTLKKLLLVSVVVETIVTRLFFFRKVDEVPQKGRL